MVPFALVPISIISILVNTPIVLLPSGSNYLANYKPSEFEISVLAGVTHIIIVLGSLQYLVAISLVIFSMFVP